MRTAVLFLVCSFLGVPASGQQTGDPNRDYSIGGNGVGATSPVMTTVIVPGTAANDYATQDANAPVVWLMGTELSVGWLQTFNNSVDIGPGGLTILGNGADPTTPNSALFFTGASGQLSLAAPAAASLSGLVLYFACAHAAPSNLEGWWISQTHRARFTTDPNLAASSTACNPMATVLNPGDDGWVQQPLGFGFPFYGTSYTQCFVAANGFVTFGQGDGDFTETIGELLGNAPRIAMWWDDLSPQAGANSSVTFFSDQFATAEVCFDQVPEFGTNNSNTFKMTMTAGVVVSIDYGAMAALDGIVGLSPGSNLAMGVPLNLTVGPNVFAPATSAPYEFFNNQLPNDLAGHQVSFVLDGNGNPFTQF